MDFIQEISDLKAMVASLLCEVKTLRAENAVLKIENSKLKQHVKELEEQIAKNSKNSSKPPSTDFKKGPAIERKKGGKIGGKEGHKGHTLEMVSTPDKKILHVASSCTHCGEDLSETVPFWVSEESRQVWDIEKMPLLVTSHQIASVSCPNCNKSHCGKFPSFVTEPTQYGANIKGLFVYLNNVCSVPLRKISQLTADWFGQRVNEATIFHAQQECSTKLKSVLLHICDKIRASDIAHFDETGVRTAGKNYWVHTASTEGYTYLMAHESRGHAATDSEESVVKDFKGKAVTDFLALYHKYDFKVHCFCNAHLIRDLNAIAEQNALWAAKMRIFLLKAKEQTEKVDGLIDVKQTEQQYDLWVKEGREEESKFLLEKGHYSHLKAISLLDRLTKHKIGILEFLKDPKVPFTNNLAERDIRPLKTKLKVATSFRSQKGLKIYTDIRSFISTLNKQSLDVITYLKKIFEGSFSVLILK